MRSKKRREFIKKLFFTSLALGLSGLAALKTYEVVVQEYEKRKLFDSLPSYVRRAFQKREGFYVEKTHTNGNLTFYFYAKTPKDVEKVDLFALIYSFKDDVVGWPLNHQVELEMRRYEVPGYNNYVYASEVTLDGSYEDYNIGVDVIVKYYMNGRTKEERKTFLFVNKI